MKVEKNWLQFITVLFLSIALFFVVGEVGRQQQIINKASSIISSDESRSICLISGCNRELCIGQADLDWFAPNCPMNSVSRYDDGGSYCFSLYGECKLQGGGKCGWTQTPELLSCLEKRGEVIPTLPPYQKTMKPVISIEPRFTSPYPKACTMDAKICPDGSSVGRIGPDCEFAPCPTSVSATPTPKPSSAKIKCSFWRKWFGKCPQYEGSEWKWR